VLDLLQERPPATRSRGRFCCAVAQPSGPRYRRASERSRNAASMLLFLGTRVRRVVGDMVTKSGQVYKPAPRPSSAGRLARCPKSDPRGTLNSYSVPTTARTEQADAKLSALRPAQV
jgi:hypothetical protein